jgi:glucosyl-3-phosphoglycerate synthase
MGYEFCKGYYPRITDRLHGRVTRLFLTPLLRTLQTMIGFHPFLVYLDSFRYPLAGEFSMIADLAGVNRIPGDWGLEVGVLAEIYRNTSVKRVCQVDLCENYEHKHQPLSPDDPQQGLMKMSIDITKSLLRNLATEGLVFDTAFFNTLRTAYLRAAQDAIKKFEDDAIINGLIFDRHEERIAVEAFTRGIKMAVEEFLQDPLGIPLITNWNRVVSAIPNFFQMLEDAVDVDNAE